MGRDLEALAARLTDEVIVHANQMVLRLAEQDRSRSLAPDGIWTFFVQRNHLME